MGRLDGERGWPDGRRKKWNMVIDVARCIDCNNCFLADKDEFTGNDFPPYSVAPALGAGTAG